MTYLIKVNKNNNVTIIITFEIILLNRALLVSIKGVKREHQHRKGKIIDRLYGLSELQCDRM